MTTVMKLNYNNLQPLTKDELILVEGGGIIGVSPWTIVQAGIVIAGAIYAFGYAAGKTVYHATH
ncbi:hypothetical protein [Chryseobacterium taklimakanense]|uniref:hypothetical protein n=1 Tax=Chryseobacterium taklimakanense TaxID=536441 RepID=UPI0023F879B1|nr:hypothetical protein [Chryseobacterium taklimakanense]